MKIYTQFNILKTVLLVASSQYTYWYRDSEPPLPPLRRGQVWADADGVTVQVWADADGITVQVWADADGITVQVWAYADGITVQVWADACSMGVMLIVGSFGWRFSNPRKKCNYVSDDVY